MVAIPLDNKKVVSFILGTANEQAYRFIFCMLVTLLSFIGMFSHRINDTNCIPIIALIVGHYLGKAEVQKAE